MDKAPLISQVTSTFLHHQLHIQNFLLVVLDIYFLINHGFFIVIDGVCWRQHNEVNCEVYTVVNGLFILLGILCLIVNYSIYTSIKAHTSIRIKCHVLLCMYLIFLITFILELVVDTALIISSHTRTDILDILSEISIFIILILEIIITRTMPHYLHVTSTYQL